LLSLAVMMLGTCCISPLMVAVANGPVAESKDNSATKPKPKPSTAVAGGPTAENKDNISSAAGPWLLGLLCSAFIGGLIIVFFVFLYKNMSSKARERAEANNAERQLRADEVERQARDVKKEAERMKKTMRNKMRDSCCTLDVAVQYGGWYGTVHTFYFFSSCYAEAFARANDAKVVY